MLLKLHSRELQRAGYVGLIVEEPPRHGKSELGTHYDTVYYLGAHPDDRVILGTYAAEFAADWGRKCRDTFAEWGPVAYGVDLDPGSRAADRWDVKGHRGGMYTVGAGGPITGRGAQYLKADDLIKNYAEAQSETLRENTWNWWKSTFRTRLEPGGIILVIGTRWHEDDIIGRLLAAQGEGSVDMVNTYYDKDADRFLRVRLPAVAEEPDEEYPDPDPLGREPGEELFPERWPIELLRPHMANAQVWSSLYQQRPSPKEGSLFQETWFEVVPHPGGRFKKEVRFWDTAATDPKTGEDPDYTVGVRMGLHPNGLYYVLDVVRFRKSPGEFERLLKKTCDADGRISFRMAQEPGSQGKLYIRQLANSIFKGKRFRGHRETGSKMLRAEVVADAWERGDIKMVRGAWNREYVREHLRFPRGTHDDQVDATSGAYEVLLGKGSSGVKTW